MHGQLTKQEKINSNINEFYFSAQLQQLESRLRYSKTDKDTAEKKQRILIEKDLVDFQAKLAEFEVCYSDKILDAILRFGLRSYESMFFGLGLESRRYRSSIARRGFRSSPTGRSPMAKVRLAKVLLAKSG